jgi:GT2 family glycosyltransferase
VFSARPEVDFVYGDSHAIDAGGNLISRVKAIPFDPDILLYDANFICQPSSFYRRRLIDDIGPFDENMHFLMDYEFFLRAAKRKARFHLVRRYLSAIRFHGQCKSLSDGVYPWHQERRRVRVRYARAKLRDHPTALALVGLIYRLKRYALLLGRGQIDFMNLGLALKLRRMAWRNPAP